MHFSAVDSGGVGRVLVFVCSESLACHGLTGCTFVLSVFCTSRSCYVGYGNALFTSAVADLSGCVAIIIIFIILRDVDKAIFATFHLSAFSLASVDPKIIVVANCAFIADF